MASVGENPALRDEYRSLYNNFVSLNSQYAKLRDDALSGDTKRAAAAAEPLAAVEQQVAQVTSGLNSIKQRNTENQTVFDSTLSEKIDSLSGQVNQVQTGLYESKRLSNLAVSDEQKNNTADQKKKEEEEKAGQKVDEKTTGKAKESENKEPDDKKTEKTTTPMGRSFSPETLTKKANTTKTSSNPTSTNSADKTSSGPGKRTWNPLGDFSNYTYRISLYAITPESYNSYKKTGVWESKDLYLICQSGGSSTNPAMDAQRAPGFDLDFYIDDLELTTKINAKEVGLSTNTTFIDFKIYEPYGATFPTKLVDACAEIQRKSQMGREVSSVIEACWGQYLISIRFYGYDVNGQLITAEKYNNGAFTKNLDSSATFERSFPIQIKDFKFRIEGKGQVYSLKTTTIETGEGLGTKRATFSVGKSGSGKTVAEVLGGQGKTTDGIIDQLNKDQKEYVKNKTQELADEFAIVFESSSQIGGALLVDESINKDRVPMQKVTGAGGSNVRKSASASSGTMKASRTISVASGTSIIQGIDQIISQSSYVSDALKVLDSEEPQPIQENEPTSDPNASPKTLQWYIILPVTEVIGFDKKRNDYAFKVTYVIKTYDVPYVRSTAIKYVPKYPGPHKIYNYWYTGKNSEVISYEQQYDMGYYVYAGLTSGDETSTAPKGVRSVPKPANGADSTGKAPGSFEGPNSVKTFLYSENDQLKAKITILGDPDFLMPVTTGTIGQMMEKWYGPDFTISPNTGQVFIELIFNQVEDYDNKNGLMIPNGNIDTMNFKFQPRPGIQEMVKGTVFMVVDVKSRFSKGRFSQDFDTRLPNFADLDISNATGNDTGGREGNGKPNSSTGGTGNGASTYSVPSLRTQTSADEQRRLNEIYNNRNTDSGKKPIANSAADKIKNNNENTTMPNDDQLVISGPNYKKTYTQANFYSGDLEREHAKVPDPANKSNRYYGLTGREAYNPANDPRRLDR